MSCNSEGEQNVTVFSIFLTVLPQGKGPHTKGTSLVSELVSK